MVGAGGWVAGVPVTDLADGMVWHKGPEPLVGSEEHGWVAAVEGWVCAVVACDVCEVLHADLQGGGGDAVAVVDVDPRTCCFMGGRVRLAVMFCILWDFELGCLTHWVYGHRQR